MKRKQLVAGILAVLLAFTPIQSVRAEGGIALDTSHFPDKIFREYVSKKFDTDKDGMLSEIEIDDITAVDCSNKGISSLVGIEHFRWLKSLNCNNNKLTKLDVSKNIWLTSLRCKENKLTKLNVRKNTELYRLCCHKNKIRKLDVSRNEKLYTLFCQKNKLTKLDLRWNSKLCVLRAYNNKLRRVDLAKGHVDVMHFGRTEWRLLQPKGKGKNLIITVATEDDLVEAKDIFREILRARAVKFVIRKKK
ncbi:MAG: hypothetical protein E7280_02650 [Lachnospiraceae bacterium]|nr:hypothetical protein [Lachnospiraceae bacterium]